MIKQPGPGQPGVGQCLQGGEGLGGHDEQGGLGVQALGLLGHVGRVDVGHESAAQALLDVGLQGLVDHHRTKIGSADPDVDHGLDPLAGDAGPLAAAHLVGERVHLVQHLVHLGHDVDAVHDQTGVARQPERGVQHRPVLGDVDVLAGEHRVPALGQPDLVGQVHQRVEDLGVDQVLGEVDVQVARGEAEGLGPLRVGGEPAAEIGLEGVVQRLEFGPGGGGGRIDGLAHFSLTSSGWLGAITLLRTTLLATDGARASPRPCGLSASLAVSNAAFEFRAERRKYPECSARIGRSVRNCEG